MAQPLIKDYQIDVNSVADNATFVSNLAADATLLSAFATAPTTGEVLTAIAGGTLGAVGTYGLFHVNNLQLFPGDTVSAASLTWANVNGDQVSTPSGTWRCLGLTLGPFSSNEEQTTLFVRIS